MKFKKTFANRELCALYDENNIPYRAYATQNHWVYDAPFALPTSGNTITPITAGKQYYTLLVEAMRTATNYIMLAGWQISWDAQLAEGLRLYDVLLEVASKKNVMIYIMAWNDTDPVQTYDDQSMAILTTINKTVGKEVIAYLLSDALPEYNDAFYSHHQKNIIIDGKVGFIGGLDVSYGRYDDAHFTLKADAEGRNVLNRYNPCIAWMADVSPDILVNSDKKGWFGFSPEMLHRIAHGGYQTPYLARGVANPLDHTEHRKTLDPTRQPRMPWQDVHCKIEGDAVVDMMINFQRRWKCQSAIKLPAPPTKKDTPGGVYIQVLRSASLNMCNREYSHTHTLDKQALNELPHKKQDNILQAMLNLIEISKHYIYLESQFFVSDFGVNTVKDIPNLGPAVKAKKEFGSTSVNATRLMPHDADALPQNPLCNALINRLDKVINAGLPHGPFHVYITLPVHPEGPLNDAGIMNQIHYTMQSLVFGSFSLLNGVRRSLKWKQLHEANDPNPDRVWDSQNKEHESIPMSACDPYVTLLNLRNWDKLNYTHPTTQQTEERYVTEQIYIHSKLTIVDDRFAIIGSANINDRSLSGERDSEIAVHVLDTTAEQADLTGEGKPVYVRKFARELRKQVWSKLFGITAGGDKAATELTLAIEQPANPKSWQAIQHRARENTKLYEAAFDWIPRNKLKGTNLSASVWPNWKYKTDQETGARVYDKNQPLLSFDEAFWDKPQHTEAAKNLTQVKGFITALPIEWTEGENNNIGIHSGLLVRNKQQQGEHPNTELATNDGLLKDKA